MLEEPHETSPKPSHRPAIRTLRLVWTALFLGLLLVPTLFAIVDFRPNDVESGANDNFPGIEPSRLLDTDYYSEIDRAAAENLSARGMGLWLRSKIDVDLLNDPPNSIVVVAPDGWAFLRAYINPDCARMAEIDGWPELAPTLTADELRFIVTEPKSAHYAERLPAASEPPPCVEAERAARRIRLAQDERWIDLDGPLDNAQAQGEQVFFAADTHWSPAGRMVAAETIVDSLSPGLWDPNVVVESTVDRIADLERMLGIEERVDRSSFSVARGEVTIVEQEVGGDLVTYQVSTATGAEVIPGTTLIIGDSQMAFLLDDIAPYFEKLVFLNWLTVELGGTWETAEPDRIVVQSVELQINDRFEMPALIDRLNDLASG